MTYAIVADSQNRTSILHSPISIPELCCIADVPVNRGACSCCFLKNTRLFCAKVGSLLFVWRGDTEIAFVAFISSFWLG